MEKPRGTGGEGMEAREREAAALVFLVPQSCSASKQPSFFPYTSVSRYVFVPCN